MSTVWRLSRRVRLCAYQIHHQTRSIADSRSFVTGDLVLLREKLDRGAAPILTRPLRSGVKINGHKGVIDHEEIIGKRVRDVVKTAPSRSGRAATEYRLHEVRLEEYVRLSKRLVTPIYPADASLIVELLDLHVEPYHPDSGNEDGPKLEILEAGTGQGALTLYLSRAIHGANPPLAQASQGEDNATRYETVQAWKRERRAVVHTIDSSAKYSSHAEKIVKGFKHGMYYNNVDFHVTDVGAWARKVSSERDGKPFLSHAFLDLPGPEAHLDSVAQALRTDGCLLIFTPSITQVLECVETIKEEGVMLELDNVVELGVNGGSGGRGWKVQAVRKRRPSSNPIFETTVNDGADSTDHGTTEVTDHAKDDARQDQQVTATEGSNDTNQSSSEWSMICRPLVGERIVGGGFLGVWRKQRDMRVGP